MIEASLIGDGCFVVVFGGDGDVLERLAGVIVVDMDTGEIRYGALRMGLTFVLEI